MADKEDIPSILQKLSKEPKVQLNAEAKEIVQSLQNPKNRDTEHEFKGLTALCGFKNVPDNYKRALEGRIQYLQAKNPLAKGSQSVIGNSSGIQNEQLQGSKTMRQIGGPGSTTTRPHGGSPTTAKGVIQPEYNTPEVTGIAPGSSEVSQLKEQLQQLQVKLNDTKARADERETELKEKEDEALDVDKRYNALEKENKDLKGEIKELKGMLQNFERETNEYLCKKEQYENTITTQDRKLESYGKALNEFQHQLEKSKKVSREKVDMYEARLKSMEDHCAALTKEKDDLRDRFSKLAGHKLTDKNADIADLSDANRPLKISEKMGSVYDDEWTDAFTELTEKVKMQRQESIHFLLECLKDCFQLCEKVAEQQIDSLKNVILFPAQDTHFVQESKGRIGSKDEQALRDVRRQIGANHGAAVKQIFFKRLNKEKAFEKQIPLVKPYLEKLADVCWLMAICDPPMFMDMTVKRGSKFDSNMYTTNTSSGKTVEYLVWPPLYNCKNGGLITKGVVATERVVKK